LISNTCLSLLLTRPPPGSTLFPYTTLFRSCGARYAAEFFPSRRRDRQQALLGGRHHRPGSHGLTARDHSRSHETRHRIRAAARSDRKTDRTERTTGLTP